MDVQKAQEFLQTNHRGVLATYRQDGSLQMSPILIGVNADGVGIISSRETAYKVKNLRRDPRASVCIFADKFYGDWIQIDGTAEILTLPDALEPLVDFYQRVVGEHPDWEDYRQAMVREKRVLIHLTIDRAGPDKSG